MLLPEQVSNKKEACQQSDRKTKRARDTKIVYFKIYLLHTYFSFHVPAMNMENIMRTPHTDTKHRKEMPTRSIDLSSSAAHMYVDDHDNARDTPIRRGSGGGHTINLWMAMKTTTTTKKIVNKRAKNKNDQSIAR